MILEKLTNRGATPALEATLSFAEARQKVIAENVANWQTPGYKTQSLDARSFQHALGEALKEKGGDWRRTLEVNSGSEVRTMRDGRMAFAPTTASPSNILFHDETNGSIERMMTDLADNGMVFEAASTLLKGYYDGLRKAIRGVV